MTDEYPPYQRLGREFASHETVRHTEEEWTRGNAHTQTIENFFSVFKRGMRGVYQHCSEQHLARYLDEFSFRYSYLLIPEEVARHSGMISPTIPI
jgi:ISXO2-like transposase domain